MGVKYYSLHSPQIRFSDLFYALITRNNQRNLENSLSPFWGSNVRLVGSGRQGIKIALNLIGVKEKDQVIVPAFICSSVGEAILQYGAIPVFADVGKDDINIDPNIIESLICKETKAIIIAHIFGIPAQMQKILTIAQKYHIPIIEDCCQSFGAIYANRLTGTWGDFSIYSFGISKNISTSGGGALYYKDNYDMNNYTAKKAPQNPRKSVTRYLTSFIAPIIFNKYIYRLSRIFVSNYSANKTREPFSAYEGDMINLEMACALRQLNRYEKTKKIRNENAEIYRTYFRKHFKFIDIPNEAEPAYLYFPVLVQNAKELKGKLLKESIEVKDKDDMLFYALYEDSKFNKYKHSNLKNVENMENKYLVFPVGHTHSETEYICKKTLKIIQAIN